MASACAFFAPGGREGAARGRLLLPCLLAGLGLIALAQALNPWPAASPAQAVPGTVSAYWTLRAGLQWLAYAAWAWCAVRILSRPGALDRLVWAAFLIGLVIAIIGVLQAARGNEAIYGLRPVSIGRRWIFGPFYNRAHGGALLSISMCCGLGLLVSRWEGGERTRGAGSILDALGAQAILLSALAVLLCGLYYARSKGVLISAALAVWCGALLACRSLQGRTRRLVAGGFVALLGAVMAAWSFHAFAGSAGFRESAAARLSMWRSGLALAGDFPWLGTGLGALRCIFPAYQEYGMQPYVDHIHSAWAEHIMGAGMPGAALAILAALSLALLTLRRWRAASGPGERGLLAGVIAATIGFLAHNVMDFSFETPSNALMFLALLAAAHVPPEPRPPSPPARAGALVRWGVGLAGIICAGAAVRPAVSASYARRSAGVQPAATTYCHFQAYVWDRNPYHLYRLSHAYLVLAEGNPPARLLLLREALKHAMDGLRLQPLGSDFHYLSATILHRLGRREDARRLLESSERVYFDFAPRYDKIFPGRIRAR